MNSAVVTGVCTLLAGPFFGIAKMSWDSLKEKADFWASLRAELNVTIKKIENDNTINSKEDLSLLDGEGLNHILGGSFNIVFENNFSKMGLLDSDQYELAISVYRNIPNHILKYRTNGQSKHSRNRAKEWFESYLADCKKLAKSLDVGKWGLFKKSVKNFFKYIFKKIT